MLFPVLWNPWSQDVQRLADLGAEEYRSMLCVEPGQVSNPVMLMPGTVYEGSMMLQVRQSGIDLSNFP